MPRTTLARVAPSLLLAVALPAARPATAEPWTATVDPAASSVRFVLDATLHTVEGMAEIQAGELSFDPEEGSISGAVVVDATSADTGNDKRDREMHQKVLESGRWPEVRFTLEGLEGDLEGLATGREVELEVRGIFTLQGESHSLVVPVSANLALSTGRSGRLRATGSFVVPYVAWGLRDPSKLLLRVGKEVRVDVVLEAALGAVSDAGGLSGPGGVD